MNNEKKSSMEAMDRDLDMKELEQGVGGVAIENSPKAPLPFVGVPNSNDREPVTPSSTLVEAADKVAEAMEITAKNQRPQNNSMPNRTIDWM